MSKYIPDEERDQIFAELKRTKANQVCAECGAPNPQWASSTLGLFICYQCSGLHRSFGVHLTFVRSLNMDSWTPKQMNVMRLGGNERFHKYLKEHNIPSGNPTSAKYSMPVFENYRRILSAEAEGKPIPQLLPLTTNTNTNTNTSSNPATSSRSQYPQQMTSSSRSPSTSVSPNSANSAPKRGKRELTDEELGWDSWGAAPQTASKAQDPLESYYAAAAVQQQQQQQQRDQKGSTFSHQSQSENAFFNDSALSKPIIPKSQRTFAPVDDGFGSGNSDGPHELKNKDGRVVAMSYDGGMGSNGGSNGGGGGNFGDFLGQSWTKMSNFAKNVYDNSPSQANLADYWTKFTNAAKNVATVNIT